MEDPNVIKKNVAIIKKKIEGLRKQGIVDEYELELKFLKIYPDLYDKYTFLTKMIIKKKDMGMLDKMIKSIEKIHSNKSTKENEEKKLGLELFNKYVKKNDD